MDRRQLPGPTCRSLRTMLSFQTLDVDRLSIDFLALSHRLIDGLPRGHAELADQLRRAAMSIPLNIARPRDAPVQQNRALTYAIARGSAMACAAVQDVCLALGLLDQASHQQGATGVGARRGHVDAVVSVTVAATVAV